jgi:hypothetical protein
MSLTNNGKCILILKIPSDYSKWKQLGYEIYFNISKHHAYTKIRLLITSIKTNIFFNKIDLKYA